MEISTVEKTILEKCAKDAGWEIGSNAPADCINLFSSFFKETACIKKPSEGAFILRLCRKIESDCFEFGAELNANGEFEFNLQETYSLSILLKRVAELFASLPDNPLEKYQKKLAEFSDKDIQRTETERLVKERVGQDIYRDALMKYWGGTCAVTGCSLKDALRASHAKPWKDCENDAERLNVFNGFLLTANLDALFDKGYISFTDEGLIMISAVLEHSDLRGLGLNPELKLRWIEEPHLEFLKYHREHIWKN